MISTWRNFTADRTRQRIKVELFEEGNGTRQGEKKKRGRKRDETSFRGAHVLVRSSSLMDDRTPLRQPMHHPGRLACLHGHVYTSFDVTGTPTGWDSSFHPLIESHHSKFSSSLSRWFDRSLNEQVRQPFLLAISWKCFWKFCKIDIRFVSEVQRCINRLVLRVPLACCVKSH